VPYTLSESIVADKMVKFLGSKGSDTVFKTIILWSPTYRLLIKDQQLLSYLQDGHYYISLKKILFIKPKKEIVPHNSVGIFVGSQNKK
jgi:hypothetical protein